MDIRRKRAIARQMMFLGAPILCQNIAISPYNSVMAYRGKKTIYLSGIGGIGMSALARWYKAQNWAVSGSDIVESGITGKLRKEGLKVHIGHKKSNINKELGLLVYNRAIKPDNPELLAAKGLGVPILPYAKALGEITKNYTTIAITGSHGKSTTTALIGLILLKAGFDPSVFVGTELKEFGGRNIRIGKGRHLVLEADDFGKAFLHYSPAMAVVTNIDREHLDTYKNLKGAQKAFLQFIARVTREGTVILNSDDKNLFSLRSKIENIGRKNDLRIIWYSLRNPPALKVKRIIKIFGAHNLSNAIAAYTLARALKIPETKILKAIGAYRGAWRRMEYRGNAKFMVYGSWFMVRVYDDYAHHPTEIKATLQGLREKFPKAEIICVFQPHQAKRLKLLFKEFMGAFNGAHKTLILPVYEVAGRDNSTSPSAVSSGPNGSGHVSNKYDSQALVRAIQKQQPKKLIFYLENPKNLKAALTTLLSPAKNLDPRFRGDDPSGRLTHVIVMMGAGDIVNYTDSLIKP